MPESLGQIGSIVHVFDGDGYPESCGVTPDPRQGFEAGAAPRSGEEADRAGPVHDPTIVRPVMRPATALVLLVLLLLIVGAFVVQVQLGDGL